MNLIVDVGNTKIKLAVFDDGKVLDHKTCLLQDFEESVELLLNSFPELSHAIVAAVGKFSEDSLKVLQDRFQTYQLTQNSSIPLINQYGSPNTLGVDRLALVSAAALQFPEQHVLVIDAGSCITYDFLTKKNKYLGGAISPGIAMRYKALKTFTDKLPLLQAKHPKTFIGNTTEDSMHVGVVEGVLNEIEGFIAMYEENFGGLKIILTGGDAHFLRDSIKNDIFANSNFLLEGLNHILEINKSSC